MNESEKRRKKLLEETRSLYSDWRTPPAVHPRYRAAYRRLYPGEETEEGSAGMQIVDQSGISSDDVPSPYAGIIRYTSGGVLSGDEFWAMLYPEEAV